MSSHLTLHTIDKTTTVQETNTPQTTSSDLLVQPLFVGVCGTDLQIIRRQRPDPATILGHEGIARIIEGENREISLAKGDVIVFNSVDPTDQDQILGHNTPGLLQQRYIATKDTIEKGLVAKFPKGVDPMLGALVEPLGTVVYGHSLVAKAVNNQARIAIVGAGAIGIMHALYAKALGYERVLLINTSLDHLEWCVKRGIIAPSDAFLDSPTLPQAILDATNGEGVDSVYMCTSRPNALAALKRALEYIRPNGCIDLVGGIKDGDTLRELPEIADLNAVRRANFCGIPKEGFVEKTQTADGKAIFITGHRGSAPEHIQTTLGMLQMHGDLFRKVISHVVSLGSAADLFNMIAEGPVKEVNDSLYIKAIVDLSLEGKIIKNI